MLKIVAEAALSDMPNPDILVVPGGIGSRAMMNDTQLISWVRTAHETTDWTCSVCTGSLVLGAAGLLDGRRATGHWLYLEPLSEYGAEPVVGRFVEDGKYVTAAGVSAGIDMALHLVARLDSVERAQHVRRYIQYDPQPPV
jgi:transcriptional regulator GlxA family with amidase domain